jgi:hypothetical protein
MIECDEIHVCDDVLYNVGGWLCLEGGGLAHLHGDVCVCVKIGHVCVHSSLAYTAFSLTSLFVCTHSYRIALCLAPLLTALHTQPPLLHHFGAHKKAGLLWALHRRLHQALKHTHAHALISHNTHTLIASMHVCRCLHCSYTHIKIPRHSFTPSHTHTQTHSHTPSHKHTYTHILLQSTSPWDAHTLQSAMRHCATRLAASAVATLRAASKATSGVDGLVFEGPAWNNSTVVMIRWALVHVCVRV